MLCETKTILSLNESYKWLKEQEELKESKIEKFLGPSFILEQTNNFPGLKRTHDVTDFEFHPRPVKGFFGIILLWPFVGLVLMGMIKILSAVLLLCIAGLVIHLTIYWRTMQKSDRKISLNGTGIRFDDEQLISWTDITLTAILTKPIGRNKRNFLVVVTKGADNSYKRKDYELTDYFSWNAYGFASTISSKIESIRSTMNSHNNGFAAMAGRQL